VHHCLSLHLAVALSVVLLFAPSGYWLQLWNLPNFRNTTQNSNSMYDFVFTQKYKWI
jgi:ABC-type uncharacterized transport system YnjBCD permease subunit